MAGLGTSFTTQGATPLSGSSVANAKKLGIGKNLSINNGQLNAKSGLGFNVPVTSPVTKALNNASGTSSPAVKSQKVTETTYHAPTGASVTQPAQTNISQEQFEKNLADYTAKNPPVKGYSGSTNLVGTTIPNEVTPVEQPSIPSYSGLISKGTDYLSQAGDVAKQAGLLRQNIAKNTQDVMGNPNYSGTVKIGQAANIAQQQGAQLSGLSDQEKALTQQGSAYLSGAGLAAPQLASFSQQAFNPVTGQFSGGDNINQAVTNVADKVKNGQMSYSDALSALSGYGQGGINALQQALPQGFNVAQSNALAGQQGTIGVNYQLAENALSNVESAIKGLQSSPFSAIQGTNIPLVNAAGNYLATQTGQGSEQTRAVTGAVQSLRNAYASLLASSKGGTPTDYSSQAIAEIPNNPTPNDIAAIRKNMETLGKARAQILGNPGQATGSIQTSQSSGGLYNF